MKKDTWFCFFGVFLSAVGSLSATGGEHPAPYWRLGVGGRQTAMGGAAAASRGDLASAFWNPAGLTGVRTFQAQGQFAFFPLGRTLGYLSVGNRFEKSPVSYAVSWMYFTAGGDLELRSGPSLEPEGFAGDTQMTFYSSTAYYFSPDFSIGLNAKVLTHNLAGVFAWGFSEDIGAQVRLAPDFWIGWTVRDAFGKVTFLDAESEKIPTTYSTGLSYTHWPTRLTFQGDLSYSSDLKWRPNVGLEWKAAGGVALRAGWTSRRWSVGFGLFSFFSKAVNEFQYTAMRDTVESSVVHQVALALRFL